MGLKKKIKGEDSKRETFFRSLSRMELDIVSKLQSVVAKYTTLEERISYSVLYYFQKSRVCFIWPSSIQPGPKKGVQFGFCNGYLLNDEKKILERENRKQVYCLTFHSVDEINIPLIESYLENALQVDETIYKSKKQSK